VLWVVRLQDRGLGGPSRRPRLYHVSHNSKSRLGWVAARSPGTYGGGPLPPVSWGDTCVVPVLVLFYSYEPERKHRQASARLCRFAARCR
jgi:hypothetical protein